LLTFLCVVNICAQQIKLPFELSKDNKSIFIKLPLENQKDSLLFFFDTGAGTTLVDRKIAEKYHLKANYKAEVMGAGGKQLYNQYIDNTNFVLDDDISRLNKHFDKKIDGIIGSAILNNYLTKIDFETRTISLDKFDDSVNYDGYEKIPFEFYNGIPKFPITFELKNNEKFSGNVLFDSGAGLTLLVNTLYKDKNNLLHKIGERTSINSGNLTSTTKYDEGLIRSIQIGNTIIKDENLKIALSSDKRGVSSSDDLLGILGSKIIYRFNFILDYKNKNLYLKPNHLFYKDFFKC